MKTTGFQTMIVTAQTAESKEFYVRQLGFEAVFDFGWYVQLRCASNPAIELSFLHPGRADQPAAFRTSYGGEGVALHLYVEDSVWSLAGWCELRQDFRNFRLDRMREFLVTQDLIEPDPAKGLDAFLAAIRT